MEYTQRGQWESRTQAAIVSNWSGVDWPLDPGAMGRELEQTIRDELEQTQKEVIILMLLWLMTLDDSAAARRLKDRVERDAQIARDQAAAQARRIGLEFADAIANALAGEIPVDPAERDAWLRDTVLSANRAARIAVTETTNAISFAEYGATALMSEIGVETYAVWYTASDDRVCPLCGPLHGREEVDWSIDHPGGPPAHPNCILPGNLVIAPDEVLACTKAFYVGRCVEITGERGSKFTCTENHPILTQRGWVPAKLVRKTDDIFSSRAGERVAAIIRPDHDHRPVAIEQVFDSAVESIGMPAGRVPIAPEQFHGDGRRLQGNVEIVDVHGLLQRHGEPGLGYPPGQQSFAVTDPDLLEFDRPGVADLSFGRHGGTADGGVGVCDHCGTLLGRRAVPSLDHRVADISGIDPGDEQSLSERGATDATLGREFLLRFASHISSEKVVKVRYFNESTHVYDLQVRNWELYFCNGVIVHNCRCYLEWFLRRPDPRRN